MGGIKSSQKRKKNAQTDTIEIPLDPLTCSLRNLEEKTKIGHDCFDIK